MPSTQITIIGGGICGLSTAFALYNRGYHNIRILEAQDWPNPLGSSHGHSRITRSAYSSLFYVNLMRRAHKEIWPRLEKLLKKTLVYPCNGIFFGPHDGHIQSYSNSVREAGVRVEPISKNQAQVQFPQFSFWPSDTILLDHTAGVIAAEQTISSLISFLHEKGIALLPNTTVRHIDQNSIHTSKSIFHSDWIISCAGPWTSTLFPFLSKELSPIRQQVFYMGAKQTATISIPQFPVWVEVGQSIQENWYGLPQFGRMGFKLARHRLHGISNDPDALPKISAAHRREAQEKAEIRFPIYSGEILFEESCIYTMREKEDYLIDFHPQIPQLIIASGFSGHGFKLAPLCGELMVDMIEGGKAPYPFTYKKEHQDETPFQT